MKTEKNILIAFLLNLFFAIIEFAGGVVTNSIAIISDAVHDLGDSLSIGISYFLEKKSKKAPDEKFTYGYTRFSVLGSIITVMILLIGSIFVIYNAILRIFNPVIVNYDGMIVLAILGTLINFIAALFTRKGHSLNQKAVNLHMLEDVLGWIVVLIGALVMKFTNLAVIDPILSIGVALFIFIHAFKNLKEVIDLFLEKTPKGIDIEAIREHLLKIDGIVGVHHMHVRSVDGYNNFATMHVVVNGDYKKIKNVVKQELIEHGIQHTTIEFEEVGEVCNDEICDIKVEEELHNHHHNH